MAKQEIIAVNLTGSPITLDFSGGIVVPTGAIGVVLSGGTTGTINIQELQKSEELYNHVVNDNILMKVDAIELTKAESLSALEELLLISTSATPEFELRDAVSHKNLTNNPHNVTLSGLNAPAAIFFPYTQETSSGQIAQYLTTTQKTNDGWRSLTAFPYSGTTQYTPSSIVVRANWVSGAGTYDIRVIDVTNASNVIAIVSGLSNTVPVDQNLGTISNLSTIAAEMELQILVTNTQDRDVQITFLLVSY